MKKSICMLALSLFSVCASADDAVADPESWYRDAYAPLWAQDPGSNVEKMLVFYADTIETHSPDGQITRTDRATWLNEPMGEWLADGWLGSELQGLEADRINGTTIRFKASWLDRDEEFPEGQAPHQVAGRPHGQIVFANSDAGASAYTHTAIDEAYRAVGELS